MRVRSILPVRRMEGRARQDLQLELFDNPDPVALLGGDHEKEAGRKPGTPTHLCHVPQEQARLPATTHAGRDLWSTPRHRWNAVLSWAASGAEMQAGTLRASSTSRLGPSVSYPCPRPSGQARCCFSFEASEGGLRTLMLLAQTRMQEGLYRQAPQEVPAGEVCRQRRRIQVCSRTARAHG